MKGKQAVETSLGAAAGKEKEEDEEEKESGDGFHDFGVLDTRYKMRDKGIIGNR